MRELGRSTVNALVFLAKVAVAVVLGVWLGKSPASNRPSPPRGVIRESLLLAAVSLFALMFGVGVLAVALDHTADPTLWVTGPLAFGAFAWAALHQVGRIRRLRKKQRRGRCPSCDYDLTGNVSGVCPECGRQVIGRRLRPAV